MEPTMKRSQCWQVALLMVTSLVMIRACAKDEAFTPTPPPPDDLGAICSFNADCAFYCTDGIDGMAYHCTRNCSADAPCPAGYQCVSRAGQLGMVCTMGPCTSNEQCPQDYVCDTEDSRCRHVDVPCDVDEDCPAATACNQGACETLCQEDDDCKQGWMCHHQSRCVLCMNVADCDDGFTCLFGQCNTACVEENDCRHGFECVDAGCQEIVGGGSGVLGDSCSEDSECATFCYDYHCGQICDAADAPSCPDGYECSPHHLICQPS
jgi:hypothetical protein